MSDFGDFLNSAQPTTGAPPGMSFQDWINQPQQMTGVAREVALPASNLAKGVTGFLDTPTALAGLAYKYLPNWMLPGISPETQATAANLLSRGQNYTSLAGRAGIVDRPDLQPQNTREKYEAAGAQGVGGALPALALTGGAGALPLLLSGAGGGVGSELGGDIGEKVGGPTTGRLLGGLLGGVSGGTVGNVLQRGVNLGLGNLNEIGQAYREAGVPQYFTPNDRAAAYSSQSLGGSGRTLGYVKAEADGFGKSAEDTAASLGNSSTLQELGDTAKEGATDWLSNFKATSKEAHDAVTSAVGQNAPVVPTATQQIISDIKNASGGSEEAESFLKSGLTKDIEKIVGNAPGGTLPWQTMRAIRSRVGEYLENPDLISDAGTTQAKRLYGAMSDDLRATAAAAPNPQAAKLFDLANAYTKTGHDYIENVVSPIISKDSPQAASWILSSAKSGDQVLGPLRQNMPDVADEAAALKLRDMALATAGKQNAAGTQVSPGSFLTDWNNLAPEAKAALYSDPSTMQKVNALATIAQGVKARQALLNTSNTAHHNAFTAAALAAAEGGRLGYEAAGIPGAIGGAVGGAALLPTANYGYSLLGANPLLARLLAGQSSGVGPWRGAGLGGYTGLLMAPNAGANQRSNLLGSP